MSLNKLFSSSAITGEGKSDFTHLAFQTLDALQSVSLSDVHDTAVRGKGWSPVCVRWYNLTRGSHTPGVPDNPSLWDSSMCQSEKSGFRPLNSEDPLCAIIDSDVDERPVADDFLRVVIEAEMATRATRLEAQFNQPI